MNDRKPGVGAQCRPYVRAGVGALLSALSLWLASPDAQAQVTFPDPAVTLHKAGGVGALARQADDKILVGGSVQLAGNDASTGFTAVGNLYRMNADGSVDLSFRPVPNGVVRAIVVSGSHAFVAGDFTQIGGQAIARLAKVSLTDGSAVAGWNPAPDGSVESIVADTGGNLYVSGSFTSIGGVSGRKVVKLDAGTGVAVSAWNPTFPEALDRAGPLLVSGSNLVVAGVVMGDAAGLMGRLHRVNLSTGALDSAFAPPSSEINHQGKVSLAADAAGNVLFGGSGGLADCTCPSGPPSGQVQLASGVIRLLASNGAKDASWASFTDRVFSMTVDGLALYVGSGSAFLPQSDAGGELLTQVVLRRELTTGAASPGWNYPAGTSLGSIAAMLATPAGLVVGGHFVETGTAFTPGLARLDATTGSPQAGWKGGAFFLGQGNAVKRLASGQLLIGGSFDLANYERHSGLVRVQANGTIDPAFVPNVGGIVIRMLEHGGSLFVGGSFVSVDGQPIRSVAKLNPATGAVDASWSPNPDGSVRRLATDGTDLFVAGGFANVGGQPRPRIAKVSAATGSVISAFTPPIDEASAFFCVGTFGMDYANGWVYSGCRRNDPSTFAIVARADRFSATTGARDATWTPNPNGIVRDIVVRDGFVYLAGEFGTVAGQAKPIIARLAEGTGALDASWGSLPSLSSGIAYVMAFVGSHLYLGRNISSPVETVQVLRVAAANGAYDSAWSPSFVFNLLSGGFMGLDSDASGSRIHVAGPFKQVGGAVRSGFASISTSAATSLPAIASADKHSLAVDSGGKVYAWGNDSFGQLGVGRKTIRPTPAQVTGLPAITQMALSGHAVAVDSFKRVWAWGNNACGQLGPRDSAIASKPARVSGVTNVTMAGAGNCYSIALRADGTVWGWGIVPGYGNDTAPRQLSGLAGIVEIAAGPNHALARRGSDGAVFAFGDNTQGELGSSTPGTSATATQVPGITGATALAASAGRSMVLLGSGQIQRWGAGTASPSTLPPVGTTVTAIGLTTQPHALRGDGTLVKFDGSAWVSAATGFPSLAKFAVGGVILGITGGGQLHASGDNSRGMLGQGNTSPQSGAPAVSGFASTTTAVVSSTAVLALKADGTLWFWGQDVSGESGDGGAIGSSVPRALDIGAARAVAAGNGFSAALDTAGGAWIWGSIGPLISQSTPTPLSVMLSSGSAQDLAGIAAGDAFVAVLGNDGTVYSGGAGAIGGASTTMTQARGFAGIVAIAAGSEALYGLGTDGKVWAAGANAQGQLGNGTTTASTTAVPVQGITGIVRRISAGGQRAGALTSDGKVWMWGGGPLGNGGRTSSTTAVQVAGITDAVDLAVGTELVLVLKSDGTVVAWGDVGLSAASGKDPLVPYAIPLARLVQAVAAGHGSNLGFLIDVNGVAWGFGKYGDVSSTSAAIGDGAYVARASPVMLLAEGGTGAVDSNNWYLDLDPSTAQTVPAAATPKASGVAQVTGAESALVVDATIKYKSADLGKRVNNYVLGLVPTNFFGLVKSAPTLSSKSRLEAKAAKTGGFVLAQLTPAGWTDVTGQLIAYSQGTANAAGNAANILDGVNATAIPGARFCIGYGESSGSMLSASSLTEVLAIEGATATASGVPCVLTGVYVDGPPSSRAGTAVTFKASVVGLNPTGTVQFTDAGANLSAAVTLSAASEAVASSSLATSSLAVGSHSIGAVYGGDGQNSAVTAEIPVRHEVVAVAAGATTTTLTGPSTSELGSQVVFSATVTGDSPSGTVQFRDGATNLGDAVPLVGGQATLRVSTFAQGGHSITAAYSGDGTNAASTSAAIVHTVSGAIDTTLTLASNAESVATGAPVTFTVTVTGSSPTGNVVFRDGATVIGTVALANGVATLTVSNLGAGAHVITAEYVGDSNNQGVTSASYIQQVTQSSQTFDLTVAKAGTGGGTVTSSPARLSCGSTCTSGFLAGTVVTLTATADTGSAFGGWSGAGCTGTGTCTVTVTAAVTVTATFTKTTAARLANIATRGPVFTGDNVMIGGFIIQGSAPKKVLVTARGPSMAAQGVSGTLADPFLTLFSGATPIASNDDFGTAANAGEIPESIRPGNAKEAAILTTLNPGAYTAIVTGVGGTTGIAIVEAFEVDKPESPLINIATRAPVLTGDNVMIGGFIIQGDGPKTVLVTARGPSLAAQGVPGVLANPTLALYAGQTVIASNDDWGTNANAAAIQATGVAPTDSLEAALLLTLNPGAYTAIVTGAGGTTGIGIVEVFAQ